MTIQSIPVVDYYFDSHSLEEDVMGENLLQTSLARYLFLVLEWLFKPEGWFMACNLNIYESIQPKGKPIAPDLAVFIGVVRVRRRGDDLKSWSLPLPGHPPPTVVFEIASDETWSGDVKVKPFRYAKMGVAEYFFYDPRPTILDGNPPLRGWRNIDGDPYELPCDDRGWMWSDQLESWLVPDGDFLRLYDKNGELRLTGEEAERTAKEAERTAKEAERTAKERAWAKLRELGVDPESV